MSISCYDRRNGIGQHDPCRGETRVHCTVQASWASRDMLSVLPLLYHRLIYLSPPSLLFYLSSISFPLYIWLSSSLYFLIIYNLLYPHHLSLHTSPPPSPSHNTIIFPFIHPHHLSLHTSPPPSPSYIPTTFPFIHPHHLSPSYMLTTFPLTQFPT